MWIKKLSVSLVVRNRREERIMDKCTNKNANKATEKCTQKNTNRTEFAEEYSIDAKTNNTNKQSKINKTNK
jgi:hypothetical protein